MTRTAPPPTDDDARELVAALAAHGGDADAVRAVLLAEVEHLADPAALLVLALTALHVTYAECLPHPVAPPIDPRAARHG